MNDQVMSPNNPNKNEETDNIENEINTNDDPPARNPDKSMQLRKDLTDIKKIKKMRKKKP
jgi:hypothetical protein